eukprot:1667349-Rhodomonas_salina.3
MAGADASLACYNGGVLCYNGGVLFLQWRSYPSSSPSSSSRASGQSTPGPDAAKSNATSHRFGAICTRTAVDCL